jgi:hypothetical protein
MALLDIIVVATQVLVSAPPLKAVEGVEVVKNDEIPADLHISSAVTDVPAPPLALEASLHPPAASPLVLANEPVLRVDQAAPGETSGTSDWKHKTLHGST